jgi:hypothetical protein
MGIKMKFEDYIKEDLNDVEEKILDFFMMVKNPTDKQVHKLAEDLNLSPDELEKEIYEMLSTFTSGGYAKEHGFTEKDADSEQLEAGINVEYEHLNKESKYADSLSRRIALDHLAEMPDYYTELAKMEGNIH